MSGDDHAAPKQADKRFLRHAQFPMNMGQIAAPTGYANGVGQCGDSVEVAIEAADGSIRDIKVMPHGCIYTVVCASAMSELAQNKSLEQALELNPEDIDQALGGLPEDHLHCARLAVNTLGEAIADHYQKALSPGAGQKPNSAGGD